MEEPRIGVYVCWCGTNIAKMVDVQAVVDNIKDMENVVVARDYKYMCSDPGQELIIKDIKENKLDRIVVSACSPRIHELTFRKAIEHAGLNPYMLQMANIREHVSWVHTDRNAATRKAASLIRAAINRIAHHEPLDKLTVEINPATLVIGGGIAGISAALMMANSGKQVYLVERTGELGGIAAKLSSTFPYMTSAQEILGPKIRTVINHPNIEVFLNTRVKDIFGYVGNFQAEIPVGKGEMREIKFGNIVVATGLKPIDPEPMKNYGYGTLPNVITALEFEERIQNGGLVTTEGTVPKNVAIIHCVGSRNQDHKEYCSRTCCMTALKYANQLKSRLPESNVYDIYADMRAFGKGCEEFYTQSSRKDIMFMMYDQRNELPQIKKAELADNSELMISMKEQLSGDYIEIPADMVVLMTAMEAHKDAKEVAHSAGISMCGNEFYIEKHPKLDPVATTTDGVYIVGSCQGPKDITESVTQAWAAASRILATIALGTVTIEVTTSKVNEDVCCGCQTCVNVCPYTAISYDEEKNVSVVNEILCKGCGTCGSACPTGAIRSLHFTDKQILSQIEGLMRIDLKKNKIFEEV